MATQDLRLTAELRFDLRELEPDTVLIEQLATLASAAAVGPPVGRRFSRRAVAGIFAGLLVVSGTAYAARDQIIVPVLNSIVGHSHSRHHAPVVPRLEPSPTTSVSGQASPPRTTSPPRPASPDRLVSTRRDQDQQGGGASTSQGQQGDTSGSGSGNAQQSSQGGTGNAQQSSTARTGNSQNQAPSSGNDNSSGSSGGGGSGAGDGSSNGQ